MVNVASIYKTVEPVIRHYYGLEDDESNGQIFPEIFDVESTDDPIFETVEFGGPGVMAYKAENERIVFDDIVQGGGKRFQAGTWATGIEISLEACEDTKYGAIKKVASSLGRSKRLTPEYLTAQYLDRAFNASYPATNDALSLCNSAHVLPKGGTQSNLLANAYSLSEFALQQVFQNLGNMLGSDGMLSPLMPKKLIVPTNLAQTAWTLMNTQLTVGSANNDRSFVAGKMDVVSFNYLGSNTRWFVKTDAADGLFWKWRIKPQFFRDQVDAIQQALYMCRFRAYWGIVDWRGIYGSNAA